MLSTSLNRIESTAQPVFLIMLTMLNEQAWRAGAIWTMLTERALRARITKSLYSTAGFPYEIHVELMLAI